MWTPLKLRKEQFFMRLGRGKVPYLDTDQMERIELGRRTDPRMKLIEIPANPAQRALNREVDIHKAKSYGLTPEHAVAFVDRGIEALPEELRPLFEQACATLRPMVYPNTWGDLTYMRPQSAIQ